jgi:hypothetical protein
MKREDENFFSLPLSLSLQLFFKKYVRMCRVVAITACLSVKQSLHEGANNYIEFIQFVSLFLWYFN